MDFRNHKNPAQLWNGVLIVLFDIKESWCLDSLRRFTLFTAFYAAPILNMVVPQDGHLAFKAGLPFFMVTF